jgi:hypothetical protein
MPDAHASAKAILAKTSVGPPLAQSSVSALLNLSKAAHTTYRQMLTIQRNAEAAHDALASAARYRAEAQEADPQHHDPAWSDDASTHEFASISHGEIHDDLLDFYLRELSK